jgi:hypothetical protein
MLRMMRLRTALSTTIVLLAAVSRAAAAQCNGVSSCTVTVVASATINAVARLSITSATTSLVAPKAGDFGTSAGVTSAGPTITVSSNTGYTLTAAPSVSTWTGPSGVNKPASDLKMKVGPGATVSLGQVGTSSSGTASTTYAISYNTVYNWTTDKPGSYSLVVNYTLTAP